MQYFRLIRLSENVHGTHGILLNPALSPICHTLEPCWFDNAIDKSCIPPGDYHLVAHAGPRFKSALAVMGVEGRSGILIHPGNSITDTRGCILPGLSYVSPRLLDSVEALDFLVRQVLDCVDPYVRITHHSLGGINHVAR